MTRKDPHPRLGEVTIFATPEQILMRTRSIARKALSSAREIPDGKNPLVMVNDEAGVGRKTKVVDVADHQPWNRGQEIVPLPASSDVVPIHGTDRNLPSQFAESLNPKVRKMLYYIEANGGIELDGNEVVDLAGTKAGNREARLKEILKSRAQPVLEIDEASSDKDLVERAV